MKIKNPFFTFAACAFVALVLLPVTKAISAEKEDAAKTAQIERGKYLVTIGVCNDCHSPKIFTEKGPEPDMSRALSGHPSGDKLPDLPPGLIAPGKWSAITTDLTAWVGPWGVSFTANLTPDKETGLGSWTEEMFIKAIRTGKHMGEGRAILPPMPWPMYRQMTDEDLKAVFAYLHSLNPIHNAVPDPIPPTQTQK